MIIWGGVALQKERREIIKGLLSEKSFVSLEELTELFPHVSEMTLRRDIEYFESQNLAIKVRGGCRSISFIGAAGEENVKTRSGESVELKRAIARKAVDFLETGRSIFIDSGSTMRAFVEFVPAKRYSFITTDPAVALELCKNGMSVVNMVGGKLEAYNQTVTGLQATKFLSDINIDIAFLTPSGFSADGGFTVANYNECELKRIVASKARTVIMLMASTKCDRMLPYTFCKVEDTDVLVTDGGIPEHLKASAEAEGVRVIIAD